MNVHVCKELVAVCGEERSVTTLKTTVFGLIACTKEEIPKEIDLREVL